MTRSLADTCAFPSLEGIFLPAAIPIAGVVGRLVATQLRTRRPAAFASMGASRV